MNNSLDKLIGNDELLTYICLILGIFNTFLMSMVITGIKHNFNIYIFLLFEALFLIFIVYFILKKKDVYSKDDDIKYDWYFYLRISIITLAFFNFSLYIYNITNDSSINPRKNGGGGALTSLVSSRSNKVAPTDIGKKIEKDILLKELASLRRKYMEGHAILEKSINDTNTRNTKKNSKIVDKIEPLRIRMSEINAELKKLEESTAATTSTASRTTTSRAAASRASREASRASRASRASASNKVLPDPVKFPYQI
jgi:hypothetical protein